ncbi:uncharacterized protein [Medicago truncatula]|uniref:uncharacterized protein isoform X2 n=1 Tax=Medicago truncatula TaxID=3880 RepID=UPI0019672B04|nr:uncharacterized protein LOC25497933 isoform X2 [Medicago truncatula]
MAMASSNMMNIGLASSYKKKKTMLFEVSCSRKRDRDRERGSNSIHPYKVIEITPPPKSLGVRCLPPGLILFPWFLVYNICDVIAIYQRLICGIWPLNQVDRGLISDSCVWRKFSCGKHIFCYQHVL